MWGEEFLVAFYWLVRVFVERSKETLGERHGVRDPLLPSWGEECANRSFVFVWLSNRRQCRKGRAMYMSASQIREFDATKGFPGEDITFAFLGQC